MSPPHGAVGHSPSPGSHPSCMPVFPRNEPFPTSSHKYVHWAFFLCHQPHAILLRTGTSSATASQRHSPLPEATLRCQGLRDMDHSFSHGRASQWGASLTSGVTSEARGGHRAPVLATAIQPGPLDARPLECIEAAAAPGAGTYKARERNGAASLHNRAAGRGTHRVHRRG